MKKAVVTGATGLIGLALVKECLKNDCEVYTVIRPASKRRDVLPKDERIHIIECDLSELSRLSGLIDSSCDVFYHLGWGHTGMGKNADIKFQTENVDFTIDAVRAAKALGCRLFVGAGSQAEYGTLDIDKISPESPADPRIPYGVCKFAAGKLARTECDRTGLVCVWVRIFSTYGYNDKKDMLMGSLIQKMKSGEHISMTAGIQQWDYLFCDDAGRAFFLVGNKCTKSAVYCLGSGQKRPLKEYVELVAQKLNYKQPIGFGDIAYTQSSVMNLCADISALTRDTGFLPQIPFEKGIELLIDSLL